MNTPNSSIHSLALQLGKLLRAKQWMVTAAESCTGGSLCAAITDVSGSSQWFDSGFITYSNAAKTSSLGVLPTLIAQHGAVSEATAIAMAQGALTHAVRAQLSIAITGIAGPTGGSEDKPTGSVWIACQAVSRLPVSQLHHFIGNRPAIRHQAVLAALDLLIKQCL